MEYSDEYLREQLPPEDPPREYIPADVEAEIQSWIEKTDIKDPNLISRSVRWTHTIFSELGLGNFNLTGPFIPPWRHWPWSMLTPTFGQSINVGLYDPKLETAGFGLSVDVPGWEGPAFDIVARIHFPRLKRAFEFAVRKIRVELHAPPNPTNATTTCWAQCNQSKQWGIITAGHAVTSRGPGYLVPLDNGSNGTSNKNYWQPVDAAFVTTPMTPNAPTPLSILNFPAAGLPVLVACKTGAQARTIVGAGNTLGFFKTATFSVLFFLDQPCKAGDSGALVHLTTGQASGIYVGAQPSPDTGGNSGRVQSLAQAMFVLDTTPYL